MSLKAALEQLGLRKCYHMIEAVQHPEHWPQWTRAQRGEAVDWDALFEGYRAAVDWPSCSFWRQQHAHYPRARVVLTLRAAESWYESVMETIYAYTQAALESEDPQVRAHAQWSSELIWQGVFGGRMHDRAHVIDTYERHNRHVIENVPPEQLLVFRASEGWEPLCRFLDVPEPSEPFPRVNTRAEVSARLG